MRKWMMLWKSLEKSLNESRLLIKGVRKTIKNQAKEQKGGFLSMLLGTSGASLLENLLKGKTQLELVKMQLELVRIFHVASSFNKFWDTKVLSKLT